MGQLSSSNIITAIITLSLSIHLIKPLINFLFIPTFYKHSSPYLPGYVVSMLFCKKNTLYYSNHWMSSCFFITDCLEENNDTQLTYFCDSSCLSPSLWLNYLAI